MICISEITLREIHLPLKEPFVISSGAVTTRRILLAELRDQEGAVAWSECPAGAAPNYSPETIDTAWLAITAWVAPRLLGRAIAHPRDVHAILEQDFRGHWMAKATLEMGAWGLAAESAGISLARFISGTRERIEVGISLGIEATPAALVAKARQALTQAMHHCAHRRAFGRRLVDQPLMRGVLADLALESEAATALMIALTSARRPNTSHPRPTTAPRPPRRPRP